MSDNSAKVEMGPGSLLFALLLLVLSCVLLCRSCAGPSGKLLIIPDKAFDEADVLVVGGHSYWLIHKTDCPVCRGDK